MPKIIYIAVFGMLGIFARYGVGLVVPKVLGPPFPYGTFLVNIVGAFIIGAIYVLGVERMSFSADLRVGIMVGFLGGFTTFSSYCLDAVRLLEESEFLYAGYYVLLSNFLGIAAAFAGISLMRKVTGG